MKYKLIRLASELHTGYLFHIPLYLALFLTLFVRL